MESTAQATPGYFIWEVPGKPISVHINLDVVDQISIEVMRGFGAIPKRGAEVGGVLVGSIEIQAHAPIAGAPESEQPEFSETAVVKVDSFENVPCEYSRGPSYLFAASELTAFANTLAQLESDPFSSTYPVGYFRSHTRDGLALATEDLDLLANYFPHPAHIALLIKPFATKASTAGFFFREDGVFGPETPLEFAFRRREMTGEAAPARQTLEERHLAKQADRQARLESGGGLPNPLGRSATPRMDAAREAERLAQAEQLSADAYATPDIGLEALDTAFPAAAPVSRRRTWIPAIAFLLLGLALGFQAAPYLWPELRGDSVKDVALRLSVTRAGENLTVRWNRDSLPVRSAERGVLEIEDNGTLKPAELDSAHLHDGTVIYQSTSGEVRFRLVIYLTSRLTVSETVDWKQ